VEEFYNQESTHLKATTTHHTTCPWVGIQLVPICLRYSRFYGF